MTPRQQLRDGFEEYRDPSERELCRDVLDTHWAVASLPDISTIMQPLESLGHD